MMISTAIAGHDNPACIDPGRIDPPVLRSDLLSQVHGLNADYLELVASRAPGPCAQIEFFAPKVQESLARLSAEHRARLAATPYAIYTVRFDDARFWRAACACERSGILEKYASTAGSLESAFCETVLLQAWHIAITNGLAARVLYGMHDAVRAALASTPLWQLRRIAMEHPNLLAPRWPTNPCFWPDLLAFVQAGDSVRLATTQLLGMQLIAAELK